MSIKPILFLSLLILTLGLPPTAFGQESSAGFVSGMWYRPTQFFDGDTVRIYVALRNSSASDISATIEFFDNDKLIGQRSVDALPGRLIEAWNDWTVTAGEHKLTARLTNVVADEIGDDADAELTTNIATTDELIIDTDTDGDGIGNKSDTDDDNDGILDLDEIENGTNPLVPDKPIAPIEVVESPTTTIEVGPNRAGLEKFFAPGAIHNTLANLTEFINDTHKQINQYQAARQNQADEEVVLPIEETATGSVQSSLGGETTVTRSGGDEKNWWSKIIGLIGSALTAGYSVVLSALAFAFSHPTLIHILLITAILIIIYRLGRRFGGRRF